MAVARLSWLLCLSLVIAGGPVLVQGADGNKPADAEEAVKPVRLTFGHIQVKGALPEGTSPPGLFGEVIETLGSVLQRLSKAGDDEKLTGVVLHLEDVQLGWAKVHELRNAITQLRKKGKQVYAYLDSGMTMDYLVASACDKVVLPESGVLMLPGLRAEVTFYKKLFDWLEVEPQMLRVGEYKSAAEPYSRSEMSPEFREEISALLDSFYGQIVAQIAESRKLPAEQVQSIIDLGVMTAADAKSHGLIDVLGYEDSIESLVKERDAKAEYKVVKNYGKKKIDTDFSGLTGMVKMMNLLMGIEEPQRRSLAPKIAVISAVGPIMTGTSQADLFGETTMGSATMIKAIRQARDDDTVKAIVLRVDSPGGSALASDLMWHELETVQKPFVVSMGDVAASGGYYISMGADRIFAEPGTVTGSIGVVGGKLAIEKFLAKLGVTTSIVHRGKNSGVLSVTTPFSDSERDAMQKLMNQIYAQFTEKAAAGRKMDLDKLEKLARGRVYTGLQAKEIGLVDEIGTLVDAIAFAKKSAGLDPDKKYERLDLPKATSPFESLLGSLEAETSIELTMQRILQKVPSVLREPLRDLQVLEVLAREPAVAIMPFRLDIK